MTRGHPVEIQLLPSKDEDYVILLNDGDMLGMVEGNRAHARQAMVQKSIGWCGCQLANDRDE